MNYYLSAILHTGTFLTIESGGLKPWFISEEYLQRIAYDKEVRFPNISKNVPHPFHCNHGRFLRNLISYVIPCLLQLKNHPPHIQSLIGYDAFDIPLFYG